MKLIEIIEKTAKEKELIKQEFEKLVDFIKSNPELIKNRLKDKGLDDEKLNLPNLENFDENLLLDSAGKVYSALQRPENKYNNLGTIFYYKLIDNLYQEQVKQGLELGEIDTQNHLLVSGSNIIVEAFQLNRKQFIEGYLSTNN